MTYPGKVLAALALAAGLLLAWHLRQLLLLVFGGLLFAVVLMAASDLLRRVLPLPQKAAVAVTVLLSLGALGLLSWFAGDAMAQQAEQLRTRLPEAYGALRRWVGGTAVGGQLLQSWDDLLGRDLAWARVAGAAATALGVIGDLALILLVGVFVAAEPGLYRRGLLALVPARHRDEAGAALTATSEALRGWLKGQALSMAFVGVATGLGLAALGVPLALILGVLAGLLDFVPLVGPIASGLLAVLFAFTQGPSTALWVALLALAIQQVEGNLLMPLIQRWVVQLPPAVGVASVLFAAGIFGLAGVLFATPLVIVALVLIQRLYVPRMQRA